jgi:PhnB protein
MFFFGHNEATKGHRLLRRWENTDAATPCVKVQTIGRIRSMLQPIPYFAFDGNCAEAMRFCAATLGGKLGIMSNRQSPFADECLPEHLDRIIHARLELEGGAFLYGGDCPPNMPDQGIHGAGLALIYDDIGKAERIFCALAEGAKSPCCSVTPSGRRDSEWSRTGSVAAGAPMADWST